MQEGVGKIECAAFLKKFFKIGYDERDRKKRQWRTHQKQMLQRKKRQEEERQVEADQRMALSGVSKNYTQVRHSII